MIPGPEGALEARYHAIPTNSKAPIVLIVPPHPEKEGTMDHPVVHTLFRTFASLEFNVLRFNFRGIGKSQGTFVHTEGEVADAAACLDWIQNKNPSPSQCWVVGFSFGAYIALQLLMRRPECYSFVAASPLCSMYDFNFLAPCPTPGLIVHGDLDEMNPKDSVIRLVRQLSIQKKGYKINLQLVPGSDHEFSDHLRFLESIVYDYVSKELKNPAHSASSMM